LWFVDGKTVHMACADPEQKPRNPKDDQVYRIVDVANPSKPVAVGRWHLPGTMDGDDAPPPKRLPAKFDAGFRAHNTNVYPERPDRCYLGLHRRRRDGARHLRPGAAEDAFALDQLAARTTASTTPCCRSSAAACWW
jgi:hypothetical protein